jgi:hypothetical protein
VSRLPILLLPALLACQGDEARAPIFSAPIAPLDHDGDGLLDAEEIRPVSAHLPPFAQIDLDGDGALNDAELEGLAWQLDALHFDTTRQGYGDLPPPEDPAQVDPKAERVVHLRHLLSFLVAELEAADPSLALPSDASLHQAAAAGSIDDPEVQALLGQLEALHRDAGLRFPAGLLSDAALPPARP